MADRSADWLAQAKKDLQAAEALLRAGHFEWASFVPLWAAEKAVRAAGQAHGRDTKGDTLFALVKAVLGQPLPSDVFEAARRLDRATLATQYPTAWPSGKPGDYYAREDAEAAIVDGRLIVRYCEERME
jgi:HEPN domain-containing protein